MFFLLFCLCCLWELTGLGFFLLCFRANCLFLNWCARTTNDMIVSVWCARLRWSVLGEQFMFRLLPVFLRV